MIIILLESLFITTPIIITHGRKSSPSPEPIIIIPGMIRLNEFLKVHLFPPGKRNDYEQAKESKRYYFME